MSDCAENRAEALFYQAIELAYAERDGFLKDACGADAGLRAEVDELLRIHDGTDGFLHLEAAASPDPEAEFGRLKPERVGDRIGRYKLLEQIGEGGFGTVWVAEQEKPMRRRVALKIIKLGMDTKDVIARFEQERQALAMMEHPNIARVLDAGATPLGRPFFVMELVRGIKITEYCDRVKLPTAERLRLFVAICHAVQHAHQKGIIHRDLKPSNILVTLHDGVPVPKVIDFGVAKATQQQRLTDLTVYTQFEQMVGTPLYMSPEQAEMSGLDIDTRSDIYSLGVLLYELLVGRTPFDPEDLMKRGLDEIRRAVREQEPQRPSTFVSTLALDSRTTLAQHRQTDSAKLIGQIRGDLDWIVMKALEKDRARRYETASGLAQDIQRHLLNEPVHARPPTQLYRFRRFAKRNKVAFAAGAAIAAALLAGTAVSMWQAFRANAALSDLRASAPAFGAMARTLVTKQQFDEAIEKLDVAIRLRPDVADYVLMKADLLQSQLRFAEAARCYRATLRLSPGLARAQANAELCDTLALEAAAQPKLSRESLALLFAAMTKEGRSKAEMMRLGKLLGEEKKLLLDYWLERLKDLPTPPEHPLEKLLTMAQSGRLGLDLRETSIEDITPLKGMPLEYLVLSGCQNLSDLSPLQGMPLEDLHLGRVDHTDELFYPPCNIRDLSPLRGLRLKRLNLRGTQVTDLTPLSGMPLEQLTLSETAIRDLSPLRGMSLTHLDIGYTPISDLTPLRGMPLHRLECKSIPALDFSALGDAPLDELVLSGAWVSDLSFLRKMPLTKLFLDTCEKARGLKVLSEIPTLEVLVLPGVSSKNFPLAELTAIEALRSHPRLQQIQLGTGTGGGPKLVTPKAAFWKEFDEDLRTRRALAQVPRGNPSFDKLPDRTWGVSFQGQPVSDITPLGGAHVSVLSLSRTQITDLAALKGMPLTKLDLVGTRLVDLQPLKTHTLTELYLCDCRSGIDLAPLAEMASLKSVGLPPNPRNIEVLRKLPALKYLSFDYVPEPYRPQRWWQTAEQFWRDLPVETLAREGKFRDAESLLRQQAKSPNSKPDWIGLGAVVLAQRDAPRFRAFCHEMMTHLKEAHVLTAARIALSRPDPGIAAADLEKLMQQVRAGKPHPGDGYFIMIEGMDDYRAGRHATAVEVLTPLLDYVAFRGWSAVAAAILPMAYYRDGNLEASKIALTRARTMITRDWPRRATTGSWQDWLIAHLLLQEAEQLMAQPVTPPTPK